MKLQASKIALMNALTFYTKGLEMSCKEKPPRPAWTAVEAVDWTCLNHGSFGAIHGLNSCFFCLEYFHRWSCIRLIRPCFNQFLWYWLFFGGWCGNCDINRYHPSFFWIFPWSHGMGDVQWLRHWLVGWLLVFYDHSESFWIILTKSCKHMENLYENCFNNTVGCLIILSTTKQPG